jgi:hypothetical protein
MICSAKKGVRMIFAEQQLAEMQIPYTSVEEIRSKDGISLYRVKNGSNSYVLKCFENSEYRREIDNYLILRKLGIATITLIAYTAESILLEDITRSEKYRLAEEADMRDKQIAEWLAEWYKQLHRKGKDYVGSHGSCMYMETDCITAENIDFILLFKRSNHVDRLGLRRMGLSGRGYRQLNRRRHRCRMLKRILPKTYSGLLQGRFGIYGCFTD